MTGPRLRFDHEHVADFPWVGTMARAAISGASHVGRMADVDRAEHVLFAQHLEVVVLVLAAEALIVIRVIRLRSGSGIENRVVEASHTARAGSPGPAVV